ncbi:hypothetical protein [Psychrobacillus vulpis]|uniref:Uncharacterized protein n=1 Tax=Psychrobacillus vulpis TaxID=2325572 RepID=A0A544TSP9_9BACI|nr:hypothetical protein [Psychrobacillus vulpis]TQR20473.1 hypothetical protein FG384_06860 [Psychrobacillus vulpis]
MNEQHRFEQMRKLTQTKAQQNAAILTIINTTAKPIKNWTISFIGTVTLIATCLLTFYLVTTETTKPTTSASTDQSIEKVYYFTNGNMDTFFEKWSSFYLHVGVIKDTKMLEQLEIFLQSAVPISKENFRSYDSESVDILVKYDGGTERRLKGLSPSVFLDINTNELLYIHATSWSDIYMDLFKNPNSNLGMVFGLIILFFAPFSVTLWFKHKFPIIKRREWSLNWTHHWINYLAIALILGFYSFWESKYGTFHIAAYASLWLLYGACQVAYRLKKGEHVRSIQLTIINHLIGTVALVLCVFGF